MSKDTHDVGVIVGRFQVPSLHEAHEELIKTVCERHDKVMIILGLTGFSPMVSTRENPLDYEARKQMILKQFPNVITAYVQDMHDDRLWSRQLDAQIQRLITPAQRPMLYGGRDSFIAHYTGKFETTELEPETYIRFSGTEIRAEIARSSTRESEDFRIGAIWSAHSRYPTCYPTVDVVILNEEGDKMLLARKENEERYRFIGGFADPRSATYEADARREVAEEAHIEITDPEFIGSLIIDDWRYRKEADKIKTLVFEAKHFSGSPQPDDDIIEVRWVSVADVKAMTATVLMPTHVPIFDLWSKRSKTNPS